MKKYHVDEDLLGETDEGGYRDYNLNASGDSLDELIEEATIAEIDQEGETLDCYGLEECSVKIHDSVMDALERVIAKKDSFNANAREEQAMNGRDHES